MKTILRYQNRKLYDKDESTYTSLLKLVQNPLDSFVVIEHKTGKDVTEKTLFMSLLVCDRETAKKIMKHLLKETK